MAGIPVPEYLAQRLSRRAVEIARTIGPRKSGRGLNSIFPIYQPGIIGIDVPDEEAYILDLDKGIKAHAMVDLAGRVIPIRNNDGTISYRRASASTIGEIPIITRASKDGKIISGHKQWYYPQKPGLKMLEKSLSMSVDEWKRTVSSREIVDLLMKSDDADAAATIFYGREMP
jgi:hypothetical protein